MKAAIKIVEREAEKPYGQAQGKNDKKIQFALEYFIEISAVDIDRSCAFLQS